MNFACPRRRAGKKIFRRHLNMKVQMKFQRILCLVSLIIGALTFVSAIIFLSGNLNDIAYYGKDYPELAGDFCTSAQSFVNVMFTLTIIYICAAVTLFITDTNKRRNYYVTNYVSSGLVIATALVVALYGIIFTAVLMGSFYGMDWEELNFYIEISSGMGGPSVSKSSLMFVISFVTSFLALADAVAVALNLIWKVKLMKGEKALLEQNIAKEAA